MKCGVWTTGKREHGKGEKHIVQRERNPHDNSVQKTNRLDFMCVSRSPCLCMCHIIHTFKMTFMFLHLCCQFNNKISFAHFFLATGLGCLRNWPLKSSFFEDSNKWLLFENVMLQKDVS